MSSLADASILLRVVKPYAWRKHDNDYNQSDEDAVRVRGHFCALNKNGPQRRLQLRAEGVCGERDHAADHQ